ncbi:MAG: hypothetical protein M1522_07380, partial [Actinobacteria bacterium]|nr:hypothetical protein [Actinomycetota bacterium]
YPRWHNHYVHSSFQNPFCTQLRTQLKPEEQYAVIERISDGPYLELFARRRPASKAGWSVWGNEIDADIVIPGYPIPSDKRPGRRRGDAEA